MQPIPISGESKFEVLIKQKTLAMIIKKVTVRMTIVKMTKCHNFDKWTFLLFLNYVVCILKITQCRVCNCMLESFLWVKYTVCKITIYVKSYTQYKKRKICTG